MSEDAPFVTTGTAAKMLGVSLQTTIRMYDEGRLVGFRLPRRGRDELGHRRIYRWSIQRMRATMHGAELGKCPACGR